MHKQKTTSLGQLLSLFQFAPHSTKSVSRRSVFFIWFGLSLFLSGCISVNIGGEKPTKSKNVKFSAPASPFEVFKSPNADRAWVNQRNGNSISFLSVCNDPADPSLDSATQDLFVDLSDLQTIKADHLTFDGRDAMRTEVKGQIDGVPTAITALVYKRNNCLYTLSYLGVAKQFEQDRATFEKFLASFEAP